MPSSIRDNVDTMAAHESVTAIIQPEKRIGRDDESIAAVIDTALQWCLVKASL